MTENTTRSLVLGDPPAGAVTVSYAQIGIMVNGNDDREADLFFELGALLPALDEAGLALGTGPRGPYVLVPLDASPGVLARISAIIDQAAINVGLTVVKL